MKTAAEAAAEAASRWHKMEQKIDELVIARDDWRNQCAVLKGDVFSLESLQRRTLDERDAAQRRVISLETAIGQVGGLLLDILRTADVKELNPLLPAGPHGGSLAAVEQAVMAPPENEIPF